MVWDYDAMCPWNESKLLYLSVFLLAQLIKDYWTNNLPPKPPCSINIFSSSSYSYFMKNNSFKIKPIPNIFYPHKSLSGTSESLFQKVYIEHLLRALPVIEWRILDIQ